MKKLSLLLILALMLSVFSACAGNSEAGGSTAAPAGSESAAPAGDNTPAPSVSSGRDDLIIAINQDIKTFDLMYGSGMLMTQLGINVYDSLLQFENDGTPNPWLAEKWEVSDNGLEYTFYLREGVKFHNGEELKASDVVFTVERGRESPKMSAICANIATIEALDDYTVKVVCNEISSTFLIEFCGEKFPIYNQKAVEEVENYGDHPIGTGAYKFVSNEQGSKIEFEAFDEYWHGAPAIKKLVYRIMPDNFTAGVALESGDIDMIWATNAATAATLEQNEKLVLLSEPSINVLYVAMNTQAAPFNDVKVRQAVNYAMDREMIQDIVDEGRSDIKDYLPLDTMPGFVEPKTRYSYDLDKALSLMEAAGYSESNPIEVTMLTNTANQKLAEVVQECLSAIYIKANLDVLETNTFTSQVYTSSTILSVSNFNMIYNDMDMINRFYNSARIDLHNAPRYSNTRVDELLELGRGELDVEKRREYYGELIEIVQEDAPYAALSNPHIIRAYNKDLNVAKSYTHGIFMFDVSWN